MADSSAPWVSNPDGYVSLPPNTLRRPLWGGISMGLPPGPEPTRAHFISRHQSYHGTTLGALAAGGHVARRAIFEPILSVNTSQMSQRQNTAGVSAPLPSKGCAPPSQSWYPIPSSEMKQPEWSQNEKEFKEVERAISYGGNHPVILEVFEEWTFVIDDRSIVEFQHGSGI